MTTTYIPTETDSIGAKFEQLRQELGAAEKKLARIRELVDEHGSCGTDESCSFQDWPDVLAILDDGKAGQ